MIDVSILSSMTEDERYNYMIMAVKAQLEAESDIYANLANVSAIIFEFMDKINWSGFYFISEDKKDELVLGPFQGKPACNRIKIGKGVCGTAATSREVQIVGDVHKFPGHIACDCNSNSEIVIPIIVDSILYGVLDIDSPLPNRFTHKEEMVLKELVNILNKNIVWSKYRKVEN